MDVCCLNRPYDDLSPDRVYLEAESVLTIISHCERGEWSLISSGMIEYELSKLQDIDRLEKIQMLLVASRERLELTPQVEKLARSFVGHGLKPFDSLHLALAESYGVDVFLTTDDRLLRSARKLNLNIMVSNPVSWLMEVTTDER